MDAPLDNDDPPVGATLRPDARRWFWSAPQRRALAALTLAATAGLAVTHLRRPAQLADPLPDYPARFDELKDRLDPNAATAAELSVLPGLGPSKAEAIVAHRAARPFPAFRTPDDLADVRGIGPAIVETIRPYLYFGADAPATTRSATR